MQAWTVNQLISCDSLLSGDQITASGFVVSISESDFWLIDAQQDILLGRGIQISHPDLDILLFDNVPVLGGRYSIYHYATICGILRFSTDLSPYFRLEQLTRLDITIGGRNYSLIG